MVEIDDEQNAFPRRELRGPLERVGKPHPQQPWFSDPCSPDGGTGPGYATYFCWQRARDPAWSPVEDASSRWGLHGNWHR